ARQLDNSHRLAHIQHEHVTALPHGTRLDHQLRRLGDGHEVAGDARMGHGDRAATADLLAEARDHRADEPSTLPKRTMVKRVRLTRLTDSSPHSRGACSALRACSTSSARRLVEPITLVGRTALSVEISTKFSTWHLIAAWAVFSVPNTLFMMPSAMLCSTMGTCL